MLSFITIEPANNQQLSNDLLHYHFDGTDGIVDGITDGIVDGRSDGDGRNDVLMNKIDA